MPNRSSTSLGDMPRLSLHLSQTGERRSSCFTIPRNMLAESRLVCGQAGCSKIPSFGVPGRKREFCARHAKDGMVSLTARNKCGEKGCSTIPSFGEAGTKKREFCAKHAKQGMTNLVKRKSCGFPGCTTWPSSSSSSSSINQVLRAGFQTAAVITST